MSDEAKTVEERLANLEEAVSGMAEALGTLADAVVELRVRRSPDGNFRALLERRAQRVG